MSRSDGTFPPYAKLDVDPTEWPDDYWDSSRTCPCGKQWPAIGLFGISPCCGKSTTLTESSVPDMRWPDAITALLRARFDSWYTDYNENVEDETLAWTDVTTNGEFDDTKASAEVEALIQDLEKEPRKVR